MAKENYFVGLEKPDSLLFQEGLEWLVRGAKTTGGWIVVNQRESIGHIARHPGLGRLAIFHKRNVTRTIIADCIMELVTKFTIPTDGSKRPMLVFHPTTELLNKLEEIPNTYSMLVIPWLAEEADGWAKKNFAKDLENPDLPSIYVDEVAVTAFKHLKFAFSESHPRTPAEYRAALCQTLQILIENGIRFEPQAMQSALVQKCGWGPVSAKQIAELSDIFLSSHSPVGYDGHGPWEPDIIKLWKIEAKKKDTK